MLDADGDNNDKDKHGNDYGESDADGSWSYEDSTWRWTTPDGSTRRQVSFPNLFDLTSTHPLVSPVTEVLLMDADA